MNLDKLLKKLELNKNNENEQKTYPLEISGETYDVKTLTRAKKREVMYTFFEDTDAKTGYVSYAKVAKKMIPTIYYSLGLGSLAERAKQDKLIVKYYDVVELLFEPDEIMQIIAFIAEINDIQPKQMEEDVENLKKQ